MEHSGQSPTRLGIVGLGNVAQEHMKGIAASEQLMLAAGADLNADRGQAAQATFGLTPYLSAEEMIAEQRLHGILVLTPARYHLEVVELAAKSGLPVLCEKPLASNLSDAEAMKDIVEQSGIRFQFGASYRFLPAMIAARSLIQSGGIGHVRSCHECLIGGRGADNVDPLPTSHYRVGEPGGTPMGLVDHGVHLIDAFAWMTGQQVQSVIGHGNVSGETPMPELVNLFFSGGAVGQLFYDEGTVGLSLPGEGVFSDGGGWNVEGFVEPGGYDPYPCTLSVYGSHGALRVYPYANRLLHAKPQGLSEVSIPALPKPNHFKAQAEAFVQLIRSGDQSASPDIQAGLAALRTVLGVYRSMETDAIHHLI